MKTLVFLQYIGNLGVDFCRCRSRSSNRKAVRSIFYAFQSIGQGKITRKNCIYKRRLEGPSQIKICFRLRKYETWFFTRHPRALIETSGTSEVVALAEAGVRELEAADSAEVEGLTEAAAGQAKKIKDLEFQT